MTDGTVDKYRSTKDFLMAEFCEAYEIELLSAKEIVTHNGRCDETRIVIVIRDAAEL